MYNSVAFSTQSCTPITTINFRTFSSPQKEPLYHLPVMAQSLHHHYPLPRHKKQLIYFLSIDLPVLDISYKWNHTWPFVTDLFSTVFKVHLLYSMYQCFIPFYGQKYSTVRIYHILFTHSSVALHLGGFHHLAIMNYEHSCISFCVYRFFLSLGYIPRRGTAVLNGKYV